MGRCAVVLAIVAWAACGDGHPPDPPPPPPIDDGTAACRAVAEGLTALVGRVGEAEAIPRDQALYVLAARLSKLEREVAIAGDRLGLLDEEAAQPDYVLRPESYRRYREADRDRVAADRDQLAAELAEARDEATASSFPAVGDPGGGGVVLASIRWRDAAAQVRAYQAGCASAPSAVDGEVLRDLVSGLMLLDADAHDVGNRTLERRLLDGDDVAQELP